MANELLDAALHSGARQLDEKLYLETFAVREAPQRSTHRLKPLVGSAPVPQSV